MTEPRNWIGVVSRDHVLRGVEGSFAMLNHGKLGPLIRLMPGDWLVCYSPRPTLQGAATLKAFTALGRIAEGEPYRTEMQPGITGFRRDVDWMQATETPLSRLSDRLEFTRSNWGMLARRGLFEITAADLQIIRDAMVKE